MSTFKKILAYILIAISIVGLLVCTFGVIGSWIINTRLTNGILNLLTGTQVALSRVENTLNLASTQLNAANSTIATVRDSASQLGDRFESNSPILDKITNLLKDEVGPTIQKVRDVFTEIEDRVQTVNNAIEVVNNLPGVQIPTLNLEFQTIRDKVAALQDAVQQLQKNILDFKSGIIKSLAPFVDKIDTIAAFLTGLEKDVNQYLDQVRRIQVAIQNVKNNIPSIIDGITIAITILFLWTILAQASLLLLASLYLRTGRMVWEIPASEKPSSKDALPTPSS